MKFYRVVDTEMLKEGISQYSFYVLPEALDGFQKMMEKYSEIHQLGEPELVDLEESPDGFILPESERNIALFYGGKPSGRGQLPEGS